MNTRLLIVLVLASCASDLSGEPTCRRTDDCGDAFCIGGRCQSSPGPPPAADVGVDAPPVPRTRDLPPPLCADAVPATAETIGLNEVLANVPAGSDGDANGDGARDAYDDEFVELVNISGETVDLAGVRVSSGGKLKHTFELLCLGRGDSVVLFGGGSVGPTITGNAMIAERRLSLANEGGSVAISAPDGTIATFEWARAPAASFTRSPQLVGPRWVSHLEVSTRAFSPGLCPDGSPLSSGCAAAVPPADMGVD